MTDSTISPLRRRMIDDMTIRGFATKTQKGYIRAVKDQLQLMIDPSAPRRFRRIERNARRKRDAEFWWKRGRAPDLSAAVGG